MSISRLPGQSNSRKTYVVVEVVLVTSGRNVVETSVVNAVAGTIVVVATG